MAEAKATMSGWNFKPSRDYGTDHRAYFEEYKVQLAENKEPSGDDAPKFRVDIMGTSIEHELLPKTIRELAELARKSGFSTEYKYSRTWEQGEAFKTGARAGEKRPDRNVDHYAVRLAKAGHGALLTWDDAKLGTAMKVEGGTMEPFKNITEVKSWLKERADD